MIGAKLIKNKHREDKKAMKNTIIQTFSVIL